MWVSTTSFLPRGSSYKYAPSGPWCCRWARMKFVGLGFADSLDAGMNMCILLACTRRPWCTARIYRGEGGLLTCFGTRLGTLYPLYSFTNCFGLVVAQCMLYCPPSRFSPHSDVNTVSVTPIRHHLSRLLALFVISLCEPSGTNHLKGVPSTCWHRPFLQGSAAAG